ncbi:hypothetical protein A6P54_17540 [Bacillus sp. MKU004]|nr:hypothetical protein A6P54_17540 [Bacillus sp. MKU004]
MGGYMKKLIIVMIILLLLSGCAVSSPEPHSSVEWSDIVVWNDKKYSYNEEKDIKEEYREIDKEIGVISFSVAGSKEESNPRYQLKNGEATFAGEGSKIYSLKGLPVEDYILVQNKIYAARE